MHSDGETLLYAPLVLRVFELNGKRAILKSSGEIEPPSFGKTPQLIVVVDVEEEFDWSQPFSRNETSVTNISELWRVQEIFDKHGIIPIFVVDYPAATTESSIAIIGDTFDNKKCLLGSQLHPWVTPPFDEELTTRNSFPGNLPKELEYKKLCILTEAIEKNFGHRPSIYRAGRYGIGKNTSAILSQLGYKLDLSVIPFADFSRQGGPDYSAIEPMPYWLDDTKDLLEIPFTAGFVGHLSKIGPQLYPRIASRFGHMFRLPGIAARTGLLNRIRLSPEIGNLSELIALTDRLIATGHPILQFGFHSSALLPGATSYVKNTNDRVQFLDKIDKYLEYCVSISISTTSLDHPLINR